MGSTELTLVWCKNSADMTVGALTYQETVVVTAAQGTAGAHRRVLGADGHSHCDISPDGERFAMIRLEEASRPRQIEIVLNWLTEVEPCGPRPVS